MAVKFLMDSCEIEKENCISDVKTSFKENGKTAHVSFRYAENRKYSYCLVYEVTEDEYQQGITLLELILSERKPDIICRDHPYNHIVNLSERSVRCLLYPARYDSFDDTYYLIAQRENNVTEVMRILPTIRYRIYYEKIRKGVWTLLKATPQMKKAVLFFSGDSPLGDSYLTYRCKGGERGNVRYGIEIKEFLNKKCEIIIRKEETVEILPPVDNLYILKNQ